MDLFLKVEPTETASMYLRVRGGNINYGATNYDIADQLTSVFTAPVSNSRIDLVQVNTSGAIVISTGTPAASPTAPDYNGLITLAEVTVVAGQTSITSSSIKDVRNNVSVSKSEASLLAKIYPVGSIYINKTSSTNPASLFGFGTWTAIEGYVIAGYKSGDANFGTPGGTVGVASVTLTAAQSGVPEHNHTAPGYAGVGAVTTHFSNNTTEPTASSTVGPTNNNVAASAAEAHTNIQPTVVCYVWERTA